MQVCIYLGFMFSLFWLNPNFLFLKLQQLERRHRQHLHRLWYIHFSLSPPIRLISSSSSSSFFSMIFPPFWNLKSLFIISLPLKTRMFFSLYDIPLICFPYIFPAIKYGASNTNMDYLEITSDSRRKIPCSYCDFKWCFSWGISSCIFLSFLNFILFLLKLQSPGASTSRRQRNTPQCEYLSMNCFVMISCKFSWQKCW